MGGRFVGVFVLSFILSSPSFANFCEYLKNENLEVSDRPLSSKINYILVGKSQRRMLLFSENQIKEYAVLLGKNPIGAKFKEGDNKTPEGVYAVHFKKDPSQYHKALMLNYPIAKDIAKAKRFGVKPGHSIAIHGFPVEAKERLDALQKYQAGIDWTAGCIAVTDSEIEEIFPWVENNTTVEICP